MNLLSNDLILVVFVKFEAKHETMKQSCIALNQHSTLYNIHRILKILAAKDWQSYTKDQNLFFRLKTTSLDELPGLSHFWGQRRSHLISLIWFVFTFIWFDFMDFYICLFDWTVDWFDLLVSWFDWFLEICDLFEKAPARRNGLSLGSALVSHRQVIP